MWPILYSLWGQEHFLTLNHSTSVCPSCERRLETHTFHKLRTCCCWRCDYSVVPDLKMIWIWLDFLATGWRLTGLLNHPTIKRLYPSFFLFYLFYLLQQEDESSSAGGWLRPRRVGRPLTRWWTRLLYGRTSREPQRICEESKSRIWGLLQLLRLVFYISGYFNSQSEISRNNAAKTELQNCITGLTLNLEEVDFLK